MSYNSLKIILTFYLLLNTSLLRPILSKQWTNTIENSRSLQHILGLTSLMCLVLLTNNDLDNISVILYTSILYFWFLLSTKMDIHWNIMLTTSLIVFFMYERSLDEKNKNTLSDKILSENKKEELIIKNNNKKKYLLLGLVLLCLFGVHLYLNKKISQYGVQLGGAKFSPIRFLLG